MSNKHYRHVGTSLTRIDSQEKVTGQATYVYDMELPGMLAKCLLSAFAHAEIISIDTSAAKALPGVKAVLTGAELPYRVGMYMIDKRILAKGKIRYHGEPVAAVAAVDERTAELAASLIKVEYKELPCVMTIEDALEVKILVHEDINELEYLKGSLFSAARF